MNSLVSKSYDEILDESNKRLNESSFDTKVKLRRAIQIKDLKSINIEYEDKFNELIDTLDKFNLRNRKALVGKGFVSH